MRQLLKWIHSKITADLDDWWDLAGDPFISASYKAELMRDFPEKFPTRRERAAAQEGQ